MSTPTPTTSPPGKVPITVAPGVTVYLPPDPSGGRADGADEPGDFEYRTGAVRAKLPDGSTTYVPHSSCRVVGARADADADASPRAKRAAATINARAVADLKLEAEYHRRGAAAVERQLARADSAKRHRPGCPAAERGDRAAAPTPAAAGRPRTGIEPGKLARPVPAIARELVGAPPAATSSAPKSRTAPAPAPAPGTRVEPCPRLDTATDLTPAEKHAVRMRAAWRRDADGRQDPEAISQEIARVRAAKLAPPHRAATSAAARADADQAGGAQGKAAAARRAMIARNLEASKPRIS